MDIYKREANSRGQVSERQPSRNAALSAAKKQRAEVEEAKRESSRARGIGKKKEKKQEKNGRVSPGIGWSSEIAIESQAAWHFPHDPWRPNRAPAPMFPSMFPCSHVHPPSPRRRLHWPRLCQLGAKCAPIRLFGADGGFRPLD